MKYQEITILPDEGVGTAYLWSKLYLILHISLADFKNKTGKQDIGVAFPQIKTKNLGQKIRIFGEETELKALNLKEKLELYNDYMHITKIRNIPEVIKGYATYSRYQPDNSIPSKARRYIKRHQNTSYEEAMILLKRKETIKTYPYVLIDSISTKQKFHLCIVKKKGGKIRK